MPLHEISARGLNAHSAADGLVAALCRNSHRHAACLGAIRELPRIHWKIDSLRSLVDKQPSISVFPLFKRFNNRKMDSSLEFLEISGELASTCPSATPTIPTTGPGLGQAANWALHATADPQKATLFCGVGR
jgi:hypothetical protein